MKALPNGDTQGLQAPASSLRTSEVSVNLLVRCQLWGGSQFHIGSIFYRGNIFLFKSSS